MKAKADAREAAPATITLAYADLQHNLLLRQNAKGEYLIVRDTQSGDVLFKGPVNSSEQRKQIPDDARRKYSELASLLEG